MKSAESGLYLLTHFLGQTKICLCSQASVDHFFSNANLALSIQLKLIPFVIVTKISMLIPFNDSTVSFNNSLFQPVPNLHYGKL